LKSLRRTIIAGYSIIAALVLGLSVFSFLELRYIEQKVAAGAQVAEFFELALEIRRFEKNYFLYRQPEDLAENAAFVGRAQTLLEAHAPLFAALAGESRRRDLAASLGRYGALMDAYGRGEAGSKRTADIRQLGKEIATLAEEMARTERRTLQALLDRHRHLLLTAVVVVGVAVVVIGRLLARRVGTPLKEMEAHMQAVAAGSRRSLDITSDDREIASLTEAFNHVLRELDLRQGQLVQSEKLAALGTLLSGVAHELNNPLSNISSSCEILAEEIDGHDIPLKKELLGQVLDETWRARRIVRSLLDYARDREFRRETIPLARLVDDTLRLIRGRIPTTVQVERRIPEELAVSGDRQRLQQVLFNLVGNAIEALAGAGEIVIAARRTTQPPPAGARLFGQCAGPRAWLEIEVRDNGAGIVPEVLPRIFDPFFTTKEVGQGLGLGLFIVFEIIEAHGGCIAVDSEPGRGTTFFVRIPSEEHP
jgi:signal transduction histidine kinase